MNRRDLFKGLASVALFAAIPLKYVSEPVYRWVEKSISFDTIVSNSLERNIPAMMENIARNNELLALLKKRTVNTKSDMQRQLDESVY